MEKKPVWFLCSKNNKQELKDYCSNSLLPVSSKMFERLLYTVCLSSSARIV